MTTQSCDSNSPNNPFSPSPQALIDRVYYSISEVSSLPVVALQVVRLADDPTTGSADLLDVVRSDPALATRLMRMANSSFYMLREKVSDLKRAITLLGFTEIRNLAFTAFVAPLFRQTADHGAYTRHGLWTHMVGTGMVAHLIAKTCGTIRPEEAYLAGLLHDLGLILIDQYLHKRFCKILDVLTGQTPTWEVERSVLGFDHASLGEYVATRWKLPDHLTQAIGYHHWPDQYQGPHREIVCAVALADSLCHLKNCPSLGIRNTQTPPIQLFIDLGLGKQKGALIAAQLEEVLKAAELMASAQFG
jgi:HD-like signal output (HDOD) protein